jgi:hypothetical protein
MRHSRQERKLRLPITITNVNKFGKTTNKWHVRIGKKWRVFGSEEWTKDGIAWINSVFSGENNA